MASSGLSHVHHSFFFSDPDSGPFDKTQVNNLGPSGSQTPKHACKDPPAVAAIGISPISPKLFW